MDEAPEAPGDSGQTDSGEAPESGEASVSGRGAGCACDAGSAVPSNAWVGMAVLAIARVWRRCERSSLGAKERRRGSRRRLLAVPRTGYPLPVLSNKLPALCLFAFSLAIPSCTPSTKDSGAATDSDHDGAPNATDCDPADATIRPGTEELCDGIDQDCNGLVDDGLPQPGFIDADGDGYGDRSRSACEGVPGYSATGDDCDDENPAVHPAAADGCDSLDNDCDDAVDEDGTDTIYLDFDSDGYGDAATAKTGCPEVGWTLTSGDCDDFDADISPLASETCDTIDNDCDGWADNGGVCPCDVSWWPDSEHAYMFCTGPSDWQTADDACAIYGYHLATFDSAAEGEWVEATVLTYPNGPSWWIGFTDAAAEGAWIWSDGSPVTYTNWSSGEPNNGHGGECVDTSEEDCAMIKWNGTAWNDYPCACVTESAVCEARSELRPD